jgi:F420-non-reducing hydrogenase iron-sulfur subunit
LRKLIAFSGLEEDRLRSRWISSAEGPEFAHEITDFIETLKKMGPSPLRKDAAALKAA